MTIDLSFCSSFSALDSAGETFIGGGRVLLRIPTTLVHTLSASEHSINLRPPSTAATKCGMGIFRGAGAKFRPFPNTDFLGKDSHLDERLTTQLSGGVRHGGSVTYAKGDQTCISAFLTPCQFL